MLQVTEALEQIHAKIEKLTLIKETLEKGDTNEILNLFYTIKQKGFHLSHFLKDNRELLRSIVDYWNRELAHTNFSLKMNEMHLNNDKLTIEHSTLGHIGEFSLSTKYLQFYKNIFHMSIQKQKDLAYLNSLIPKEEEKIVKYEEEWNKYQNYPTLVKRVRGFDEEKMEKMKKILEQAKEKLTLHKEDRKNLVESLSSDWDHTMSLYVEYKRLVQFFIEHGYTHNFFAMDESKTYFMRYRKETNHSHSGMLTYEEKHLSILNKAEWDEKEMSDSNLENFNFTEEEFAYLYEQIQTVDMFEHAKREWLNKCDCITIEAELGTIVIAKNGFIVTKGEDINLHHLLRYPNIRTAMCLLYKERTHQDFLDAILSK